MSEREFQQVVEEGRALQRLLPGLGLVAVGGTAAALHCHHRVSVDVDAVTPQLQDRFEEVASALDNWDGWKTNRRNPRVMILGERHGVELGLRQQRRPVPLQTTQVAGLIVPTPAEMLRVKAYLLAERQGTRDYVDLAALASLLGEPESISALRPLNLLYPTSASQTVVSRLAEACEAGPVDLAETPLALYKGLKPPFTDWTFVASACQRLARDLLKLELSDELPKTLAGNFNQEGLP